MRRATVSDPVTIDELRRMAKERFGDMINLRPSFGNRSRGVDDPATQAAITRLVERVVLR